MNASKKAPRTASTKTTAYDQARLAALLRACESSLGKFGEANLSARGRALENGRRLIELREFVKANKEAGLTMNDQYARLRINSSTALGHIRLAESWEQARSICDTCGLEFDTLTITEVVALVEKGEWPGQTRAPAGPGKGLGDGGDGGGVVAGEPDGDDAAGGEAGAAGAEEDETPFDEAVNEGDLRMLEERLMQQFRKKKVTYVLLAKGKQWDGVMGDRPVVLMPKGGK